MSGLTTKSLSKIEPLTFISPITTRHCSLCHTWQVSGYSFSVASAYPHSFVCEDCLAVAVTFYQTANEVSSR